MVAQIGAFPVSAKNTLVTLHGCKAMNSGIFSIDVVEANIHADLAA